MLPRREEMGAETKEQLGGFFLISARELNEAIQVASKFPSVRFGTMEVRPVRDIPSSGRHETACSEDRSIGMM
ncbi:MAG TPA: YciI family protein [Nitrospira sp.]|nr:YciI family protein [Nitrospira sp.]